MRKRKANAAELEALKPYELPEEGACVLEFSANEELFRQGEPIRWFLFMLKGTVDVWLHDRNGGRLSFGYSISKGTLGEIELLSEKTVSNTTVIAATPVTCLAIPFETAARELTGNVTFSNEMGKTVALTIGALQVSYLTNMLATGEQRLATFVLHRARGGVFRDTLSDTASVIGVSYRHIFRMMGKLCDDGLLEKQPDGYHILNDAELRRRCAV